MRIYKAERKELSPTQRNQALLDANYTCVYCDNLLGSIVVERNKSTVLELWLDHFIPYSFFKSHLLLLSSCMICNQIKHDKIYPNLDQARLDIQEAWKRRKIELIWIPTVSNEEDPHKWATEYSTWLCLIHEAQRADIAEC